MKLLFYEKWTVESPLDTSRLIRELQKYIEPIKIFRKWGSKHMPLEGIVNKKGFMLKRVTCNRDSFSKVLVGKFIPNNNGTTINLCFMPSYLGFIGIFIFCAIFIPLSLLGIVAAIYKGVWGFCLCVCGMFLLGIILAYEVISKVFF